MKPSIQEFRGTFGNVTRRLQDVVQEISERDCSNAEDRVLSVLKLLGVHSAFQVRTGQFLNAQLLQLVRRLGDEKSTTHEKKLLVFLALVDAFGNVMPGMSWMPHFEIRKGSWQEGARFLAPTYSINYCYKFDYFEPEVIHCEVSDTGMLQIEGDVCRGHFETCDGLWEKKKTDNICTRDDEVSRCMVLKVQGRELIYVYAHMFRELAQHTTCIIGEAPRRRPDASIRDIFVAFELANGLHSLRPSIPIWLVKMGIDRRGKDTAWLVCIGEGDEGPLHKIGLLSSRTSSPHSSQLLAGSQKRQCCIDGLGHAYRELLSQ
ncbi:hypothetical protein L7F22_006613 [Adiantum nelumboides]|nr:hypothetical protein [Adiantum nelumboides]